MANSRTDRRDLLRGMGMIAAGALLPPAKLHPDAAGESKYPAPPAVAKDPIVVGKDTAGAETKYGAVAGYVDRGVLVFKGIPYAATTAGAGRFKPPKPPEPWSGTRGCRAFGPEAPQAFRPIWRNDEEAFLFQWDYGYQGEDCLRLNIWTPSTGGKGRPVMIYIHGGGFQVGSSQELKLFDGVNLASRGDVVLVTINHRLNVLGYLNLAAYGEEYSESGNAGTLDTVAALRWVRDNISQFGGDPGSITLFGQSGGGGKICTLMSTPAARGLFHKASVESGAMLRIASEESSLDLAARTLKRLGVAPSDVRKLEEMPYEQLERACSAEIADLNRAFNIMSGVLLFRDISRRAGYLPVMDGKVVLQHPFDPSPSAQAADIPLLIGTTLNEFTNGINHPDAFDLTDEQMKERVGQTFSVNTEAIIASYRDLYPNANPFEIMSVIHTAVIRESTLTLATRKAAQEAPVYCYQFTWQTPVLDGRPMAFHCAELPFVFDNTNLCEHMTGGGEEAHVLAGRVSQAWVHFARSGNPNHAGLPRWNRFNDSTQTTMIFDKQCKAIDNLDTKQIELIKASSPKAV